MSTQQPTVVLVHGAFADSSSWDGVIRRLQDAGIPAVAVANPLRSTAVDAQAVADVVDAVDGPVVLVAHSIGGFAVTNGATGSANVGALVYVAGFAPDAGESAATIAGKFPGSTLGETLEPVPLPDGTNDMYIAEARYPQQFAADVDPELTRVMAITQRPIVDADLEGVSGEPAWKTIPSWFVFGELDRNIPVAAHRWMAERAGSRRTIEVPGASHVVGMSHPNHVVELVQEAIAHVTSEAVAA